MTWINPIEIPPDDRTIREQISDAREQAEFDQRVEPDKEPVEPTALNSEQLTRGRRRGIERRRLITETRTAEEQRRLIEAEVSHNVNPYNRQPGV